MVGTLGMASVRCSPVTPKARSVPASTCGFDVTTLRIIPDTRPARMAVTALATPRSGMCCTSIPAMPLGSSMATRAVVDGELLAERSRKVLPDETREGVGAAARRRRHDDPHRPVRVIRLRCGGHGQKDQAQRCQQQGPSHFELLGTRMALRREL